MMICTLDNFILAFVWGAVAGVVLSVALGAVLYRHRKVG